MRRLWRVFSPLPAVEEKPSIVKGGGVLVVVVGDYSGDLEWFFREKFEDGARPAGLSFPDIGEWGVWVDGICCEVYKEMKAGKHSFGERILISNIMKRMNEVVVHEVSHTRAGADHTTEFGYFGWGAKLLRICGCFEKARELQKYLHVMKVAGFNPAYNYICPLCGEKHWIIVDRRKPYIFCGHCLTAFSGEYTEEPFHEE